MRSAAARGITPETIDAPAIAVYSAETGLEDVAAIAMPLPQSGARAALSPITAGVLAGNPLELRNSSPASNRGTAYYGPGPMNFMATDIMGCRC